MGKRRDGLSAQKIGQELVHPVGSRKRTLRATTVGGPSVGDAPTERYVTDVEDDEVNTPMNGLYEHNFKPQRLILGDIDDETPD